MPDYVHVLLYMMCMSCNIVDPDTEYAFVMKAYIAQQAGALRLIVYNNDHHTIDCFISMLSDDELSHMSNGVTIPTAFMRGTDG